jgi:hypothetical protein
VNHHPFKNYKENLLLTYCKTIESGGRCFSALEMMLMPELPDAGLDMCCSSDILAFERSVFC